MAVNEKQLEKIRINRWRARTDILFLCNKILDYPHVEAQMHGPIIDILQKFPVPTLQQALEHDKWTGKTFEYKPLKKMMQLEGKRRSLILWPRSTLKTTLNVQAHSIQWILNYPDIALAVVQSNTDKAEMLVQEIKRHFQYNAKLRELFPELCPSEKKASEFGRSSDFSVLGRAGRREPTVSGLTIEKSIAGKHFDLMKFTDIVEYENCKNKERIANVKTAFYMAEPLLVTPDHWIDVEGTRYHFEDLYGELIEKWLKQKASGVEPSYKMAISSCWKRKFPDKPFYTPDALNLPFEKDENGKEISIWPVDNEGGRRLSYDKLMELKEQDPYIYSSQYLNYPLGGIDGKEVFEVVEGKSPQTISVTNFYRNIRVSYRVLSIDTAESQGKRANYSAIAVGAFDSANRCYVEDIGHGKWLPDELISKIIYYIKKYNPEKVFIEKTSFVTGLMVGLQKEMHRHRLYNHIEEVRRSTQMEKNERIQNSLQPWYKSGDLRFVLSEINGERDTQGGISSDIWTHLVNELRTFPLGRTDDILDALSDLFTGKEYFGRLSSGPNTDLLTSDVDYFNRQINVSPKVQERIFRQEFLKMVEGTGEATSQISPYFYPTGGL